MTRSLPPLSDDEIAARRIFLKMAAMTFRLHEYGFYVADEDGQYTIETVSRPGYPENYFWVLYFQDQEFDAGYLLEMIRDYGFMIKRAL